MDNGPVLPQFQSSGDSTTSEGGGGGFFFLSATRRRHSNKQSSSTGSSPWRVIFVVIACVSLAGVSTYGVIRSSRKNRHARVETQHQQQHKQHPAPSSASAGGTPTDTRKRTTTQQDHRHGEVRRVKNEEEKARIERKAEAPKDKEEIPRAPPDDNTRAKAAEIVADGRQPQAEAEQDNKEFVVCPDGTKGRVNDDYCDCSDGSDEPMTSACSHLLVRKETFPCGDGSGLVIYASRVGDGIQDCPDGSDELQQQRQ